MKNKWSSGCNNAVKDGGGIHYFLSEDGTHWEFDGKISRKKALAISRRIMEQAEKERAECAEKEARRGIKKM